MTLEEGIWEARLTAFGRLLLTLKAQAHKSHAAVLAFANTGEATELAVAALTQKGKVLPKECRGANWTSRSCRSWLSAY